jgi:phosphatidylserine/phosphatidylglycerophosphate/cardiolipin synthase-like enzyme
MKAFSLWNSFMLALSFTVFFDGRIARAQIAETEAVSDSTQVAADPFLESLRDVYPAAGFYNNADGSPVFKMIDSAKHTLDIEIYLMADLDVRVAIRKALARHVKIRVVREPKPLGDVCRVFDAVSTKDTPDCVDQKKLKDEIIAADGDYVPFNKPELCANPHKPCYLHGKMVISDQKALMVSTGNFNSSNLCNLIQRPDKCNRDFTVVTRDPEVIDFLGSVFNFDVKGVAYDLPSLFDASISEKVTVSPLSLVPLIKFIKSAKHSIDIENQYLKQADLNAAIIERAHAGVKINITVASPCSFGRPTAHEKLTVAAFMKAFQAAGVSVRMMPSQFKIDGKPGYLHSKAIVVDGTKAWVGSVNGSVAGTSNNREFGMFLNDVADVSALDQILLGDHTSPYMETWQESLRCKKDRRAISNDGDI